MINTTAAFKRDILDLFARKRGGHVQRWVYSDRERGAEESGSALWHAFLRACHNYYVLPNEIDLIRASIPHLAHSGRLGIFDTIVDFGPGDENAIRNKAMPVILGCENARIYAPIDLSQEFLRRATSEIATNCKNIAIQSFVRDFFKDTFVLPGRKRLGIFFGATISNQEMMENGPFPENIIIQRLEHIGKLIGNDNEMLITFDANPDSKSAVDAYDHITWRRLFTGVMYDIKALLKPKGNFRPSAWHHESVWDDRAHVIHQCITADRDQNFSIDGQEFRIQKGERFIIKNNFKFPVPVFQAMAKNAGYKINGVFQDSQKRMTLQHLLT